MTADTLRGRPEWNRLLGYAPSEARARVLVEALDDTISIEEKAWLLEQWFNCCDAIGDLRLELGFHFEDVAAEGRFLTDVKPPKVVPPLEGATIYRATYPGDDPYSALSWTLARETAEKLAAIMVSGRGAWLGIQQPGVRPVVLRATCVRAWAYFDSRDEREVVPADVEDVAEVDDFDLDAVIERAWSE